MSRRNKTNSSRAARHLVASNKGLSYQQALTQVRDASDPWLAVVGAFAKAPQQAQQAWTDALSNDLRMGADVYPMYNSRVRMCEALARASTSELLSQFWATQTDAVELSDTIEQIGAPVCVVECLRAGEYSGNFSRALVAAADALDRYAHPQHASSG